MHSHRDRYGSSYSKSGGFRDDDADDETSSGDEDEDQQMGGDSERLRSSTRLSKRKLSEKLEPARYTMTRFPGTSDNQTSRSRGNIFLNRNDDGEETGSEKSGGQVDNALDGNYWKKGILQLDCVLIFDHLVL